MIFHTFSSLKKEKYPEVIQGKGFIYRFTYSLYKKSSEMITISELNKQRPMQNKCKTLLSSFIQTLTVGLGITPNHTLRLVGYTTGRETIPALKTSYLID